MESITLIILCPQVHKYGGDSDWGFCRSCLDFTPRQGQNASTRCTAADNFSRLLVL